MAARRASISRVRGELPIEMTAQDIRDQVVAAPRPDHLERGEIDERRRTSVVVVTAKPIVEHEVGNVKNFRLDF
jgi:hypothetical protein